MDHDDGLGLDLVAERDEFVDAKESMGSREVLLTVAFVFSILCVRSDSMEAYDPRFFALDIGQTHTGTFGGSGRVSMKPYVVLS